MYLLVSHLLSPLDLILPATMSISWTPVVRLHSKKPIQKLQTTPKTPFYP